MFGGDPHTRVKGNTISVWNGLEILPQRCHSKTSLLPSQEQDIPLGKDFVSSNERTLWSDFMWECLFRKKNFKEKGAGESFGSAPVEQKEVPSSDYNQQSSSQQKSNTCIKKAEKG